MIRMIGGPAISGKSEWLIKHLPLLRAVWIGTGDTSIEPMRARHTYLQNLRKNTSPDWGTVETIELAETIRTSTLSLVAVDSLTCWISRLAVDAAQRQSIDQVAHILSKECHHLIHILKEHDSLGRDIWLVSNEIGTSLPSPHPLERLIREVNGRLNCQVASLAQEVVRMDFGIPSRIKGNVK